MVEGKRWFVNYTKHVHQKRKVYHDGILELNSLSRKVMLYDDDEKLLDSRFLKKDEEVEYGGTLAFESHLVDIGELHLEKNPATNSRVSGRVERSSDENSSKEKISKKNPCLGQKKWNRQRDANNLENLSNPMQTGVKEWDALYTTQLTQKVKRYHDGVLQLTACGSHMNQVTLLSEDGTFLGSKYLKSAAFLKSGVSYELSNYLVQICEPRNCEHQTQQQEIDISGTLVQVPVVKSKQCSKIQNVGSFPIKKSLREEPKPDFSKEPMEVSESEGRRGLEATETSERKPVRDVIQILSNLQGRKSANPKEVPVEVQSEHAKKIASDIHFQSNYTIAPDLKYVDTISQGGLGESNDAQTTSVNSYSRSLASDAVSMQNTTVSTDHFQLVAQQMFQAPRLSTLSKGSLQASNYSIEVSNETNLNQEASLQEKSLSSCALPNDRSNDSISFEITSDLNYAKHTQDSFSGDWSIGPSGKPSSFSSLVVTGNILGSSSIGRSNSHALITPSCQST